MAAVRSVAASCGYVLTDAGRARLRDHDTCKCLPIIEGGIIECRECGTVLGLVREALTDQRFQSSKSARS